MRRCCPADHIQYQAYAYFQRTKNVVLNQNTLFLQSVDEPTNLPV
jgi:hypothetical protein